MRRLGILITEGRGWRAGAILVVATIALASPLVSSAGAKIIVDRVTGQKFGIVPVHRGSLSLNRARPLARVANAATPTCDSSVDKQCASSLAYHNGPVQHGENLILFFWDPNGFSGAPGYVSDMQNWLNGLAAGSFSTGNVASAVGNPISVTEQYYDLSGPGGAKNFVPYAVHNGGTVMDTDPYPTSGCTDSYTDHSSNQTVTLPICLNEGQLFGELHSYVVAHNLPKGINTEYFILTPRGVGSCNDPSSTACAYSTYCAWHTALGSPANLPGMFVIADQPWVAAIPGCDPIAGSPFPYLYSSGIDATVNTFSHELAETMTDPDPADPAWAGSGGGSDEIGDKCADQFSVGHPAFDRTGLPQTAGGSLYNTTLSARNYLLQMEYDNQAGGCNQWNTDPQPTAAISGPSQAATGSPAAFSLTNVTAPAGIAYVYWYFGDGASTTATSAGSVQHTYSGAGTRTVTAILTDNHGNEVKMTKPVTVAGGAGNVVRAQLPSSIRVHTAYLIKLSGHAVGAKTLYAFLDYHACAPTPAGEHARANGYIWTVQGDFSKNSTATSPVAGLNHVCAYLVNSSEPKNPAGGVVAHVFVTYTVHH